MTSILDLMEILHVNTMILLTESLTLKGTRKGFTSSAVLTIDLSSNLLLANEETDWQVADDRLIEEEFSEAQKVEVLHWSTMKTP